MLRGIASICAAVWTVAGIGRAAEVEPSWPERGFPQALYMSIEPRLGPGVAGRVRYPADLRIARAGDMEIDAGFDDSAGAEWAPMNGDSYVRQDDIKARAAIEVPAGMTPTDDQSFLGFTYDQMGPQYEKKYKMIDFLDSRGVVLTAVKPDPPAAKAGLREGDVPFTLGGARATRPSVRRPFRSPACRLWRPISGRTAVWTWSSMTATTLPARQARSGEGV